MRSLLNEAILRILQESKDFKELEIRLFEYISGLVTEIMEELLSAYDQELRDTRNKKELRLKDTKEKNLQTLFGDLKLKRRYYLDREGKSKFLLDEKLGIPAGEKKSPGLKELSLELVQEGSYRRTRDELEKTLRQYVSHAAIHQWVQRTGERIKKAEEKKSRDLFEYGAVPESQGKKQKMDLMFMEVDGLNIALQGEKKRRGEIKLGISYDGWEKRHPQSKEYKLRNKRYYGGEFESEKFWERTTAQTYEYYDFNEDAKVILNGDGDSWIKKGEEYLPHLAYLSLDKFHWHREIRRVLGRSRYFFEVHESIVRKDQKALLENLEKAKVSHPKSKAKEEIERLKKYLLNNWEGLWDYREKIPGLPEDCRGLGGMESNIDKYANRFKKKGMSWSRRGATNMAKVMNASANGNLKERLREYSWNIWEEAREHFADRERSRRKVYPVRRGKIPALAGPHRDRVWVKGLRQLLNPLSPN